MTSGAALLLAATLAASAAPAPEVASPEPPLPAATAAARPSAPGRESLLLGGELGRLSPGGGAGTASVDWKRTTARGAAATVGAARFRVPDSRWTVARIGGVLPAGGRAVLDGDAAVGPGRRAAGGVEEEFTFLSLRAGVTGLLVPRRLWVRLGDRYLDVEPLRGHLLEGTLTVLARPTATLAVTYGRSGGGNLGAEYASARVDLERDRVGLLAGVAAGRSAPELFDLVGAGAAGSDFREIYAGVRLPAAGAKLTLIADHLELPGFDRGSLSLLLELPLGGGGGGR